MIDDELPPVPPPKRVLYFKMSPLKFIRCGRCKSFIKKEDVKCKRCGWDV
jgi:hypothetical protein